MQGVKAPLQHSSICISLIDNKVSWKDADNHSVHHSVCLPHSPPLTVMLEYQMCVNPQQETVPLIYSQKQETVIQADFFYRTDLIAGPPGILF